MKSNTGFKVIKFLRNLTLWILLIISVFFFIFALVSGSEGFGGGFMGIIRNSPNAIPWLLLLIINWFIRKYELWGGIILMIFAFAAGIFFDAFKDNFTVLYIIIIPLVIIGIIQIIYYFSNKAKTQ